MTRHDLVRILDEIALMLEMKGENPFKAKAYEHAARMIETLEDDPDDLVATGKLASIKGIGEALNKKITELVTTGHLPYYEDLKASIPPGHFEMLKIPGLGPRKIIALYNNLGIETIGELEYACLENRLVDLKGFGKKTQDNILNGIVHVKRYKDKRLFADVIPVAEAIVRSLSNHDAVRNISLAGSLRRGNEVVKDIDILAASDNPLGLADTFVALPDVESIIAKGDTKVSVILSSGTNSDLRIVSPEEFPYALHHFTGSREHNTAMRGRAKKMGMKMNEYGLFSEAGFIACDSEQAIFRALGLDYIPPELRENMGEIEAAENHTLPDLLKLGDIRGVFHIHTQYSDGAETLDSIVREAKNMGYEYIGISDHSRSAAYAGGLSVDDIKRQHAQIDALNEKVAPFRIFKGIESDIQPGGALDYDEETLSTFDFVIAAVHSNFAMTEAAMTERIMTALSHPYTTMLAHPTGRLLLAREPYSVNMQRIIDHAAAMEKIIELNANPLRLDLDWRLIIQAKKKGVKIAINPDIHQLNGFKHMAIGVQIARKGWLSPDDCINCLTVRQIDSLMKEHRQPGAADR
ncbi:MAG: DNA polymerase/3'-5' exonuclease PolX [Syntrophus sp. SKADARSKE-3]|nr:DNA polymerase/3'-5' exonuclease PolX [Syntrophus sp. SKADARSKE-3]